MACTSGERLPPKDFASEDADLAHSIFTKFAGELELEPQQEARLSLGRFTEAEPFKGYCIDTSPDSSPEGSLVARLVTHGSAQQYDLFLVLANRGGRTLTADVWML